MEYPATIEDSFTVPGRYWHPVPDGRIQCDLCPRYCKLREGQRGLCFVRQRSGNQVVLTTYGRSSGFCIDPIEKKPLNHFYPGSPVLSFGTAGCNLACKFCQNWDISKSRETHKLTAIASPEDIAQAAADNNCKSVAFTYNDPVIFHEYATDIAEACHQLGINTVAVSAGYITETARIDFFRHMDAVNIDLKAFSEKFYYQVCGGQLQPVLDTLEYIHQKTDCWLEITTLLIPGKNDNIGEIRSMCQWLLEHLGDSVPLHFSAFHPDWKMQDVHSTPEATLRTARSIAKESGLKFVYLGNIHDHQGSSTYCPNCNQLVIGRDWYRILEWELDARGRCIYCMTPIPGKFTDSPGIASPTPKRIAI